MLQYNQRQCSKLTKLPCEFVIGNAECLPYCDEYFDKIVCSCSSALEHFNDDAKAVREANRVLKPNGSIVVTVDSLTYPISNELKEKHRQRFYVRRYYTRETLTKLLESEQIEICESGYLLNSRITNFLLQRVDIKYQLPLVVSTVIYLISLPICLLFEAVYGKKNKGFSLVAKGKKDHKN
jgi:ubiquinone/menaquinone biosynthesis C-methylase UbiE